MLKNLLIYRMVLTNLVGFIALIALQTQGYVTYVFANDHSHVSYLIATLFLVGLVGTFNRAWKVSEALNVIKETGPAGPSLRATILKMPIKNGWLTTLMNSLTGIGIVGTVIGMSLMFAGLTDGASTTEVLKGASVAFMCTLLGVGLTVWTEFNVRMLSTATDLLIKDSGAE
jgi:hypothetical protein